MYAVRAHDGDIEYGVNEYVCDTVEDLESLPRCKMGSTVLVLDTSSVYVKDGNGDWREI